MKRMLCMLLAALLLCCGCAGEAEETGLVLTPEVFSAGYEQKELLPTAVYLVLPEGCELCRNEQGEAYSAQLLLDGEEFGTLVLYRDFRNDYFQLLAYWTSWVFYDRVTTGLSTDYADPVSRIDIYYPAKESPACYLRIYLLRFDGYVAMVQFSVPIEQGEEAAGAAEKIVRSLRIADGN